MTLMVWTALVGGLGAVARFALDTMLSRWPAESWVRLLVINGSGSALLGLLAGLAADRVMSGDLALALGIGFLGGYTTFSAASLATVRLAERQRWAAGLVSSFGMFLGSAGLAAIGLAVGLAL